MNSSQNGSKKISTNERIRKSIILLDKIFYLFESNISGVAIGLLAVVVFVGVVMRYIFQMPYVYGEELSRYLAIVCVFTGISIGVGKKSHLGVTSFVNMMPKKVGNAVKIISDLVTLATYIYLDIISIQFVISSQAMGTTSIALKIPMTFMYSLLIFCFTLCSIRTIMIFWSDYFDKSHVLDENQEEVML